MQFELFSRATAGPESNLRQDWLQVGSRLVRLWLVPNPNARRYVLRLRPDGDARVAIPRRGSLAQARRFAEMNVSWLEHQLQRQAARPRMTRAWLAGSEILFRGEPVRLEPGVNGESGTIRVGNERLPVRDVAADLRPEIEPHLWGLASRELPPRVWEWAHKHGLPARRVTVRNQRTRWGSCSRHGTISLNWRLVQTPPSVTDYIILHELAHLKEMNHSRRFWREVAALCPEFLAAEKWLKAHGDLLRS